MLDSSPTLTVASMSPNCYIYTFDPIIDLALDF